MDRIPTITVNISPCGWDGLDIRVLQPSFPRRPGLPWLRSPLGSEDGARAPVRQVEEESEVEVDAITARDVSEVKPVADVRSYDILQRWRPVLVVGGSIGMIFVSVPVPDDDGDVPIEQVGQLMNSFEQVVSTDSCSRCSFSHLGGTSVGGLGSSRSRGGGFIISRSSTIFAPLKESPISNLGPLCVGKVVQWCLGTSMKPLQVSVQFILGHSTAQQRSYFGRLAKGMELRNLGGLHHSEVEVPAKVNFYF